jgi:hypothetical protein
MSVRRTTLIIAIFAIIACGIGSVQADAAPTGRGQAVASWAVSSRGHCETVHSSLHGRTGTVCVAVVSEVKTKTVQAEVTFSASSGRLKEVTLQVLQLAINGKVVESVRNVTENVQTVSKVFPYSWWDEPAPAPVLRAGVDNACLIWTDGSKACTGSSWLYAYAS